MLKYNGKYYTVITFALKKPLREMFGRKFASDVLRKAKPVYKDMLARTDDIGADNPMASNTYMGYVFLAVWKAADGRISKEQLKELTVRFVDLPIINMIKAGKTDINKPEDMEKMTESLRSRAAWADAHPEYKNKTWDFNFDEKKHQDGVYYHFTHCPIEKFARENGYIEVLPVICDFDHLTIRWSKGILHREKTLATGGDMCDYWIVPDKIRDPR